MKHDWPSYANAGVRGATYMHVPTVHWGLRTLTQNLYARLTADPTAAAGDSLTAEYSDHWYGKHGNVMRRVYSLAEDGWQLCAQWRAWASWSVLRNLLEWDGAPPKKPMKLHEHMGNVTTAIRAGRDALSKLQQAVKLVGKAKRLEYDENSEALPPPRVAVNPDELRRSKIRARVAKRLAEDIRLLGYGADVMGLTLWLLTYYHALHEGRNLDAKNVWSKIEDAAERLEGYVIPIDYESPGPGLRVRDALDRSQLAPVVQRCRVYRQRRGR